MKTFPQNQSREHGFFTQKSLQIAVCADLQALKIGGDDETRTHYLDNANVALGQWRVKKKRLQTMAKKSVKIGQKKEFHHISAVKEGKGSLLLERNDFGKVYYHSAKKKLILKLTTGTGFSYEIFPVEQYEEANEKAKQAEEQGKQSGKELGITNPEEDTARMLWRRFVQEQTEHGLEVKSLVDVVLEAIENERRKDTTPLFSEVAFQFLEHKETLACWCEEWRSRITKRILLLSKAPSLAGKTLFEVSARDVEAAIRECVYSRRCKNSDISKNTLIQWQKLIKEIFKWWFDNSNGEKPPSLQLKNPLARYEVGTFRNMEEPELISVPDVRMLLLDLWVHEKFAIPFVATQIFCGVRNREAAKIQWKDFKNDCTILYLPKAKTKNKIARNVPVPPCLTSWLKAYCLSSGVPDPNSFLTASKAGGKERSEHSRIMEIQHAIERALGRTGVLKPRNSFRHTAVSAMCVLYDEFKAAQWAGHDRKIQGEFYKSAMSKQEAEEYFNIFPPPEQAGGNAE